MKFVPALLIAAGALQSAPAPACPAPLVKLSDMFSCVRLKVDELAATDLGDSAVAREAVGACDGPLDALKARAEAATGRERDTDLSLHLAMLDRLVREAEAAVRRHRGAQ